VLLAMCRSMRVPCTWNHVGTKNVIQVTSESQGLRGGDWGGGQRVEQACAAKQRQEHGRYNVIVVNDVRNPSSIVKG
jgi:hypothetical protein